MIPEQSDHYMKKLSPDTEAVDDELLSANSSSQSPVKRKNDSPKPRLAVVIDDETSD